MQQSDFIPQDPGTGFDEALTRIHEMYTLSNTPEPDDDINSEVNQIMIDNFIKTMAEVALSIANRKDSRLKQETD